MDNPPSTQDWLRRHDTDKTDQEMKQLVSRCFQDIRSPVIDHHTHLIGIGTSPSSAASGCCIHAHFTQPFLHPILGAQFKIHCAAARVTDSTVFDVQYVDRLVSLIKEMPSPWGKHYLLAFDRWYNLQGKPDMKRTGFYVSNEYMLKIVELYSDYFQPCISVHPYRKDALTELEKYAQMGVRMVKWHPNAMGIDPENSQCIPFYKKCVELKMVLLTHTGEESSLSPGLNNELGNPLLLRAALDQGVIVIAAHCASIGQCEDLDSLGREKISCFKLFLRLMDEPKYQKLLFGDISALIGFTRLGDPLTTILDRSDLHHRLIFGSDYPAPAVNFAIQTGAMVLGGYLTNEERVVLNRIYDKNPLLFDFLCKRLVRSPRSGNKFAASVFMANPKLSYDHVPNPG